MRYISLEYAPKYIWAIVGKIPHTYVVKLPTHIHTYQEPMMTVDNDEIFDIVYDEPNGIYIDISIIDDDEWNGITKLEALKKELLLLEQFLHEALKDIKEDIKYAKAKILISKAKIKVERDGNKDIVK